MTITINFSDNSSKSVTGKNLVEATRKANGIIHNWVMSQYKTSGKIQRPSVAKNGNVWTVSA